MTPQDIIDATNTFGRYGVPEENIFQEVMRARYLDYFLFSNPSNAQYGISIEDLYENMKKTADRLGLYEGDADTYARVYTLALRVDPMAFAPGAGTARQEVRALLKEAGKKAEEAGQTILFSGAENYLPVLDDLFKDLTTKRIALAMNSPEWKEKLHMVFPRGRMMMEEELDADTEAYNYIFNWETSSIAHAASITRRLSEKGTMDVLIPYALLLENSEEAEDARKALAAEGKLVSYYDTDLGGKEYAFLRFAGEKSPAVSLANPDLKPALSMGMIRLSFLLKILQQLTTGISISTHTMDLLRFSRSLQEIFWISIIPSEKCSKVSCLEDFPPDIMTAFLQKAFLIQESGKTLFPQRRQKKAMKGLLSEAAILSLQSGMEV